MTRLLLLTLTLATTLGAPLAAQTKPQLPAKADVRKAELFIAIRENNSAAVKRALAQGADPNSRNWLNFTPLMWAANRGNCSIVSLLIQHGAKLEDTSIYGTALTFAELGRQEAMAQYLLDKHANPNAKRVDGTTPLMLAAANGHVSLVQRLLKLHCKPDQQDTDGATALIYAARSGQTATGLALLNAGASLNIADIHGRTALMYAAANGREEVVKLLIARHAKVDATDRDKATALLLAARYNGNPAIVRSLLAAGAKTSVQDSRNQTALSLAQARGYEEAALLLHGTLARTEKPGALPVALRSPKQAIESSVAVLQGGLKAFTKRAACTSCHHQGLGLMALGQAQQHGFMVDQELVGSTLQKMGEEGKAGAPAIHQALTDPDVAKTIPAVDIGDISIGAGYILGALIANRVPGNPGLAESALFLAQQQAPDGHWGYGFNREPIQSSYVTTTALSLQVLRAYAPEDHAAQLANCYDRAKNWLLTVPTPGTEDKASRLLGLYWAKASAEERMRSLQELTAIQRPDGGWAQQPGKPSDAYATGLALYALHVGGEMPTSDPVYQRGISYLLRTQDEDGSWYINKQAMPANIYFDAGFPHGESQYASFGATCWATIALLQATEPVQTARQ